MTGRKVSVENGAVPNVLDSLVHRDRPKKKSPFFKKFSEAEIPTWIYNEYQAYLNYHKEDREREDRNHRYYSALDYSQWSDELKEAVMRGEESRDLSQYNFLHKKVNGLMGTLIKNPTDIDFVPVGLNNAESSTLLKEIMLRDKEVMGWEQELNEAIKDGIIYGSILRMEISDKISPLGNIALKRIEPGKVLTNPDWKTQSLKDCQSIITVAYMTAYEAKEKYPEMAQIIDDRIHEFALNSSPDFGTIDKNHSINEYQLRSLYGEKYRFIEYHHIVQEKGYRLVGTLPDGTYVEVPEPPSSLETEDSVKTWLDEWFAVNYVDKESVIKIDSTINKYYVTTVCLELSPSKPFENNISNVQIGRLPFFNFSYDNHNGRNIGVIDLLADPQTTFNKRMSMISAILGHQAKGGFVFDPEAFGNDQEKIRKVKQEGAKPGFVMDTEPGYLQTGNGRIFEEMPSTGNNAQSGAYQNASQMLDMLNQLTPQSQTLDAQSDNRESARLFGYKREQSEINMTFLFNNMERLQKEIGESYFYLSKSLYSGIYRELPVRNGKPLAINVPTFDEYGMEYLENDISMIPRQSIVVSQSASGLTQRINDRITSVELIRVLPPEAGLTKMSIMGKVVKNLENLSDEDRQEYAANLELEKEVIKSQLEAQIINNKATSMQIEMQMQQMMQPQPSPEELMMAQQQAAQQGGQQGQQPGQPMTNPNADIAKEQAKTEEQFGV